MIESQCKSCAKWSGLGGGFGVYYHVFTYRAMKETPRPCSEVTEDHVQEFGIEV